MDRVERGARVAVIGGGIAGLAAAQRLLVLRPGARVTVLEGAAEVGGKLRSGTLAGAPIDLGAESFLATRNEAVELAGEVGLAAVLVHPAASGAGVWTRGAVRPLPATLLGVPADPAAAAEAGVISAASAALAARESDLPPVDVTTDVGVGVLVSDRLGPDIRDRLVEPLLGGVYAGRADDLSFLAAVPALAAATAENGGLLAAARATAGRSTASTPVFAGIRGGVGVLASAVADDIRGRGGVVRCGAIVRELRRGPAVWQVVVGPTTDERVEEFDAVVVATPAPAAARLLGETAPVAAAQLAGIEYASMAIVSLAFDTADVPQQLAGSGFLVPPIEGRVIKAATFSSNKWAWQSGEVMFARCSIGRWRDEHELQHDDDTLVAAALADLREAIGLQAVPIDTVVTRWGGALPQYLVGHLDRVAAVRAAVAREAGLVVCGAAYGGVGIPAVIADAQAAATRVAAGLSGTATMGS